MHFDFLNIHFVVLFSFSLFFEKFFSKRRDFFSNYFCAFFLPSWWLRDEDGNVKQEI